jgi:hypothetical protein
MRTAVRKEVTSFGTLNTFGHEFCHHFDFKKVGLADSRVWQEVPANPSRRQAGVPSR